MPKAIIFDIDGTLVDSNYHHTLAWFRAFRDFGITVPGWRLHRAIGMGGDMYVGHVAGDEVEQQHGDQLRDAWTRFFDLLINEIQPLPGAREGVIAAKRAGYQVALASSGQAAHIEHFLGLLDVDDHIDVVITNDDVERSKPHTDLLDVAMDRLGTRDAVMIGDSVWDVEAAQRAGVPSYGTLAGGFGEAELLDAGAQRVVERLDQLNW